MKRLKEVLLVWLLVFVAIYFATLCGDVLSIPKK